MSKVEVVRTLLEMLRLTKVCLSKDIIIIREYWIKHFLIVQIKNKLQSTFYETFNIETVVLLIENKNVNMNLLMQKCKALNYCDTIAGGIPHIESGPQTNF